MKRVLVIIFLVIIAGIAIFSAASYFYMESLKPPSVEQARYGLQTYSTDGMNIPSRVYYANNVIIKDGKPTMQKYYWVKDGEKYRKVNGNKELNSNTKIIVRRGQ